MNVNTIDTQAIIAQVTAALAPVIATTVQQAVAAQFAVPVDLTAPASTPAPKAAVTAPEGKLLTHGAFKALKATKKGRKALAGVSYRDIADGRVATPAGYRLPTGARQAAIRAYNASQA